MATPDCRFENCTISMLVDQLVTANDNLDRSYIYAFIIGILYGIAIGMDVMWTLFEWRRKPTAIVGGEVGRESDVEEGEEEGVVPAVEEGGGRVPDVLTLQDVVDDV